MALQRFADAAVPLPFHVDSDGANARDSMVFTIREYVIPRLADLDGPLVAVILGSTGAGKSTLMNSLAGRTVTQPGAIRPTTRDPVVWCHHDHADRYRRNFITGYGPGAGRALHVEAGDDPLLEHLTIVDAPDIDSVELVHHEVAADLRRVADLVIFVTSAQRYADQVPWDVLADVRDRGTPVVFVINRVPPGGQALVADHDRRLEEHGFGGVQVAVLPELHEREDRDLLPDVWVSPLRSHLRWLADEGQLRRTRRRGLRGALEHMVADAVGLQLALDRESELVERLLAAVDQAYVAQRDELHRDLENGELIRGEVLDRWQEFVGTGEILKSASAGIDRVRSWTRTTFGGRPRVDIVRDQAREELSIAVVRRAQLAVGAVVAAWEQSAEGRELLARDQGMAYRVGPQTETSARRAVQRWTAELARLVESEGEGRRRVATVASTGVNAVAVVALLATFANTGGITGAEVGITAGAAAAQQRVLEHVFGSAAARSLVARGRESLQQTMADVLDEDAARYRSLALSLRASRTHTRRLGVVRNEVAEAARRAGLWSDQGDVQDD